MSLEDDDIQMNLSLELEEGLARENAEFAGAGHLNFKQGLRTDTIVVHGRVTQVVYRYDKRNDRWVELSRSAVDEESRAKAKGRLAA